MNVKEVDDEFIGLKYELSGGREIVKFNSASEEVYTKSFEEGLELSDVIQTSSGKVLVTANEQKIFVYDPKQDTFSSIDSESVGHPVVIVFLKLMVIM